MKVKEVMTKKVPKIYADDSIGKAIKLLVSIPQKALPVIDKKGKVVGELNQKELLLIDIGQKEFEEEGGLGFRKLQFILKKGAKKVKDLMERHEFTISPDYDVLEAAKILYDEDLSTIPVIDEKGKLLGILSDICILKHYKKILGKK